MKPRPSVRAVAARAPSARAHAVRIIGGRWKRTRLPVADAPGLRPTPDRVRETVFNWLGQDLTGWRCVDAFAGSGALGFEAASRGAASVLMIERDRRLAQNLQAQCVRLAARAVDVRCGDAFAVLAAQPAASADLVFLDPPFAADLCARAAAAAQRVLAPAGLVYLEADQPIAPPPGFAARRAARAGAVHYHLFIRQDGASAEAPRAALPQQP